MIMKKLYIYKLGLVLAILSLITSCEDIVEVDLPNDQINTEDVYKDITTTKGALSHLYSSLRETSLFQGGSNGLGYDLGKYTDQLNSFSHNDALFENLISPINSPTNLYWSQAYTNLYAINAFIEGLSQSTVIEESVKNSLLGEAYFLRGLYYHYLTQLYGDIPYVTSTNYKINTSIKKTPYQEVLNLVEVDLKTALNLISLDYRNAERLYPNQGVVELLLAKNYLLQKRYDLAELYANKVLNNSLYHLELDINKVFKKNATSTIWQLSPATLGNPNTTTYEASKYIFTNLPPVDVTLSRSLLNIFEPQDLRLQYWTKEVTNGVDSYSHAYKYKNNSNNTDEYSIVFRLEEAYFTLAEALAYQVRVPEAVTVLNQIRTKRGLLPLAMNLNQTDFITELVAEYQREFFTEHGHRFFDLKRNNRLDDLKLIKPNWEDKHQLLPIPESEILMNPNLKPQNDEY